MTSSTPPTDPFLEGILNRSTEAPENPEGKPKGREPPPIPVGWGNIIVDSLRPKDPAGLARRLRDELSLGEERTSYGVVLEALDRSAKNIDDASRLYRAAKLEEETYNRSVSERIETLRARALQELMAEYKAKLRPSPTKEAIEDRIRSNWSDEYNAIQGRIADLHAMTRSLENLLEAWKSRAADLRIMAGHVARPH